MSRTEGLFGAASRRNPRNDCPSGTTGDAVALRSSILTLGTGPAMPDILNNRNARSRRPHGIFV